MLADDAPFLNSAFDSYALFFFFMRIFFLSFPSLCLFDLSLFCFYFSCDLHTQAGTNLSAVRMEDAMQRNTHNLSFMCYDYSIRVATK